MKRTQSIICQFAAIADHVLETDYSGADLREFSVEMFDTRCVIEAEIPRLDGVSQQGRATLRKLLTPDGAA